LVASASDADGMRSGDEILHELGLERSPGPPPDGVDDWIKGEGHWWDLRGRDLHALLANHKRPWNALHNRAFSRVCFGERNRERAWLAGVVGMTSDRFKKETMVQDADAATYEEFLEFTARQRPDEHSIKSALYTAPRDAANVYRALSGMWTAQGQSREAGDAYV